MNHPLQSLTNTEYVHLRNIVKTGMDFVQMLYLYIMLKFNKEHNHFHCFNDLNNNSHLC